MPELDKESKSDIDRQEKNESESSSSIYESIESEIKKQSEIEKRQENSQVLSSHNLRDRKKIKPHSKYDDYVGLIGEVEDIFIEKALSNPQWKRAMLEEMNALNRMKTWKLTELPKGRKPLTCKWVLRKRKEMVV